MNQSISSAMPIRIAAILLIAAFTSSFLFSDSDLQILTFPIGLVIGEQEIDVDLGAGQQPADLYLDGKRVCVLTSAEPVCVVDFGPAPRVHLLELIRKGASGAYPESDKRWVNRPGQEAELAIQLARPSADGVCSGRLVWYHPEKKNPTQIEVTDDGRPIRILDERGAFRFPCVPAESNQLIVASVVFPDGGRAEAVAVASGFGNEDRVDLTAVALSLDPSVLEDHDSVSVALGDIVTGGDRVGSEVVFVLDPGADYRLLLTSPGANARTGHAWLKAESSLLGLSKLWFVVPDARLRRIDGFASLPRGLHGLERPAGKEGWLRTLFAVAASPTDGGNRLSDAVAASGLVAAAGPRKRAVVLVLGDGPQDDESLFTPAQARSYLSEVGVPLVVLRTGKARDDGWPPGVKTPNMNALANALQHVQKQVLSQQVAWFRGARTTAGIAADLPSGFEVAGWFDYHQQRGELGREGAGIAGDLAEEEIATTTVLFGDRVEVSAVRILLTATDADGGPITDLKINELSVTEDGREVTVIGLEPVRTQLAISEITAPGDDGVFQVGSASNIALPVTVYAETGLSGSMDTAPSLRALARRAEYLTRLGPVDLVVAGSTGVHTIDAGITDGTRLRAGLNELSSLPYSRNAIERIRVEYMRDVKGFSAELTTNRDDMPTSGIIYSAEMLARRAIAEEKNVIQQSIERMNDWAVAGETRKPRVLIAVGTGFDEQPGEFYRRSIALLDQGFAASRAAQFMDSDLGDSIGELGRELAAAGFLVFPAATRISAKHTRAAEFSGEEIIRSFHQNTADLELDFLLLDPVGSQRHLAKASGGHVVGSGKGIEKLVDESSGWYVLTYQVDRKLDGEFHQIRVVSTRPQTQIGNTLVAPSGTSEGRSASRLRRLLVDQGKYGDLKVEMSVGEPRMDDNGLVTADVTVTVPLDTAAQLFGSGKPREIRISIAVENDTGLPNIRHDVVLLTASQNGLHYTFPAQYSGSSSRIAVIAEDLASGMWGGIVQTLPN